MTALHPSREELLEAFYDAQFVARRYFVESSKEEQLHWILHEIRPELEMMTQRLEAAE